MKIVNWMVADAKGKVHNLVDRLRQDTFDSYTSIREAKELKQRFYAALRHAASGVQVSFRDALRLWIGA